jgi:hypothetical protein
MKTIQSAEVKAHFSSILKDIETELAKNDARRH